MDRSRHSRARARATLRRWLRPPRTLRPTRAGWTFFALTFAVGFASINTGNNLLYLVLAFMLAFLVLSGVLSESALRGVRVRRRIPREVFAEQPAALALEISNDLRRVPAFALVVEDLAEDGRAVGRTFVLRVPPRGSELRTYRLTAARRGRLRLAGFRVSTRFPFGLFSKAMLLERADEILVYPAVDPRGVRPPPESDLREGETARTARGAGIEAAGLRAYVPGDAYRRVHWRSSLRQGRLLVRDTESERNARVEVTLPLRAHDFERAVRRAASEVVAFLDAGLRVALRCEAGSFEAGSGPRQRARLLAFLALVEPPA